MEEQGYESLQTTAERHELGPLPPWKEVSPETQEHVLRVLRRLSLSRALDPEDGLGVLEREVGIGEDRALRVHLLLSCFEMLADELVGRQPTSGAGRIQAGDPDIGEPFFQVFSRLLDDPTLEWMTERCWVYRDDPLVAWAGLDEVEAGFSRSDGEDLDRLVAARDRWDGASAEERLRLIAATLRAVMVQYTLGGLPFARSTRSVWGNVGLLRKLSEAARADRLNLLSETAFESLRQRDLPSETFQGASVILDGDELFVCRGEIPAAELADWAAELASWKPRAEGHGEALFAWDWGGALVFPEAPSTEHLESWLQESLARLVSDGVDVEPEAAAVPATASG